MMLTVLFLAVTIIQTVADADNDIATSPADHVQVILVSCHSHLL